MSTSRTHQTTTLPPSADGPTDDDEPGAPSPLGDGRYRLGDAVTSRRPGGLRRAYDTRLGRAVLVQCSGRTPASSTAARRLATAACPGVAPVLDAGDGPGSGGVDVTWTVFPATDWPGLAAVSGSWAGARGPATAAAWIVAASGHVATLTGRNVALSIDDVFVDPQLVAGGPTADVPVQWLPALGGSGDDGPVDVVADLGRHVDRWNRRRWATATAPLTHPHGRRRAARALAALAGIDPRVLGLPPVAPHHAGRERRSSDRRPPVGVLPITQRRGIACESVEAFS